MALAALLIESKRFLSCIFLATISSVGAFDLLQRFPLVDACDLLKSLPLSQVKSEETFEHIVIRLGDLDLNGKLVGKSAGNLGVP